MMVFAQELKIVLCPGIAAIAHRQNMVDIVARRGLAVRRAENADTIAAAHSLSQARPPRRMMDFTHGRKL